MSATNSMSNTNAQASTAPTTAGSSGGSPLAFDPRYQKDFRIGGFVGETSSLPSTLSIVDKDGGTVLGDVDSDPSKNVNEDKEKGDDETDKARKKRDQEFMERLQSGVLGHKFQRPGTVFTLPVERPK